MFRESLRQHPHSVWALFGLKEAQRAKGDEAAAAQRSGSSTPSGKVTAGKSRYRCCRLAIARRPSRCGCRCRYVGRYA